ncbi:MAG: hypothetical protein QOH48_1138 [Actinomycetota bacterium]|jgi:hypothetical protein|nr:hypothetical protein [Actinomycetota bacterium]
MHEPGRRFVPLLRAYPHSIHEPQRNDGGLRPHLGFAGETCGSGLTGTPGKRVILQGVRGFKSLRLRCVSPCTVLWLLRGDDYPRGGPR